MKYFAIFFIFLFLIGCRKPIELANSVSIPTLGNSWYYIVKNGANKFIDFKDYVWKDKEVVLRTYFRVEETGVFDMAITMEKYHEKSELEVNITSKNIKFKLDNNDKKLVYLGKFVFSKPGYYHVDILGISKSGLSFPKITNIVMGSNIEKPKLSYVTADFFYWGRRGPSVHLRYEEDEITKNVEWFYNEVKVTKENDVTGSFYMANGFKHGYFGMQTNSADEKRILFSVWSPFTTDNPAEIPKDQRVDLINKGEGVTSNDFGNEGSGGQSYWKYNWKPDVTYKFLLGGKPDGKNGTIYSAYFYAPELGQWKFIAMWRRPLTNEYLSNYHSFLENFLTESGPIQRQVSFANQWICNAEGNWKELTRSKYTADNTAKSGVRKDYAAGVSDDGISFYLKNCGFFTDYVEYNNRFERNSNQNKPQINFNDLPLR